MTPEQRAALDAAWEALDRAIGQPIHDAAAWRDAVLAARARVEALAAEPYAEAAYRLSWLDTGGATDRLIGEYRERRMELGLPAMAEGVRA